MGEILILKRVKDYMENLPKDERVRLANMIELFMGGEDAKKVRGYSNVYKLHAGDYRIIYTMDGKDYMIIAIGKGNHNFLKQ